MTLIELLVAMAIVVIGASIMIVSLSGARTTRALEGATLQISSAIREAQNNALTGKFSTSSNTVCRHRVWIVEGESVVHTSIVSGSGCATETARQYDLSNGVKAANSQALFFTLPHARVFDGSGTELTSGRIDLQISKESLTYHVCVYPGGRVEEAGAAGCP